MRQWLDDKNNVRKKKVGSFEKIVREAEAESEAEVKRNTAPRDQILPVSINWPTNYKLALFSKLPTITQKFQKNYKKPR